MSEANDGAHRVIVVTAVATEVIAAATGVIAVTGIGANAVVRPATGATDSSGVGSAGV
jgi:hypothetical protein